MTASDKPRVIGFLGRAGSGKTTAAQYLCDHYGAHRQSFAGPLKKMAMELWGFSNHQVFGPACVKEEIDYRCGVSPRQAMQRLGESVRQQLGEDAWTIALCKAISVNYQGKNDLIVIDDVRYMNEAALIATTLQFHGKVIKIVNPNNTSMADRQHPSETQVDQVPEKFLTATIQNSMDDRFMERLDQLVDFLGWAKPPEHGAL